MLLVGIFHVSITVGSIKKRFATMWTNRFLVHPFLPPMDIFNMPYARPFRRKSCATIITFKLLPFMGQLMFFEGLHPLVNFATHRALESSIITHRCHDHLPPRLCFGTQLLKRKYRNVNLNEIYRKGKMEK